MLNKNIICIVIFLISLIIITDMDVFYEYNNQAITRGPILPWGTDGYKTVENSTRICVDSTKCLYDMCEIYRMDNVKLVETYPAVSLERLHKCSTLYGWWPSRDNSMVHNVVVILLMTLFVLNIANVIILCTEEKYINNTFYICIELLCILISSILCVLIIIIFSNFSPYSSNLYNKFKISLYAMIMITKISLLYNIFIANCRILYHRNHAINYV